MLLLGAGIGAGMLMFVVAARPRHAPLHQVFGAVEGPGRPFISQARTPQQILQSLLSAMGVALAVKLDDEDRLRRDLAVTGSTLAQHGLVKAAWPSGIVVGIYIVWTGLAAVGAAPSPVVATLVGLTSAAVAFAVPDIRLRTRAASRRAAFRHALSAYLDLVAIIMSGGGGLQTALVRAAESGEGWAFGEIRYALDRARLSGRTPWSQLGLLADQFDIRELRDLVAAAELSGSEGARLTESVATKADVLRARLQAEVEKSSEALTEQMLLPVGLLLVALFLFLGFAIFDQLGGAQELQTIDLSTVVHVRFSNAVLATAS